MSPMEPSGGVPALPAFGRVRSRLEAVALDRIAARVHRSHGHAKQAAIGAMTGTVLEVGAGTGVNMRYYRPGVRVIAVEPNPVMHPALRAKADARGIEVDIRTTTGEHTGLGDDEVDHAVGTLVLCGVRDPAAVLREIQRVVRPGGRYFFLEHVVAEEPGIRALQAVARPVQRWVANGCDVMRDTGSLLAQAGFASLDIERIDDGWTSLTVRIQVRGTAVVA